MIIYKNFTELYKNRKELSEQGWIYIEEEDFEDLENANYYLFDKGELTNDDYTETEDDVVPTILFKKHKTIVSLIELHIFKSIYENMEQIDKEFKKEDYLEALYHYVEEDTFLY